MTTLHPIFSVKIRIFSQRMVLETKKIKKEKVRRDYNQSWVTEAIKL
jgi:hypothetical protein